MTTRNKMEKAVEDMSPEQKDGLLCSKKAHCERIERYSPHLASVDPGEIREPPMPVGIFVQEGNLLVMRAKEEEKDLKAVGMPDGFLEELQMSLEVLRSAQIILQEERISRKAEFDAVLERARAARLNGLAAGELAFRHDEKLMKRIAEAKDKGDAVDDLVTNLLELSVLLTDNPEAFQRLGLNVDEIGIELAAAARQLEEGLARYRFPGKSSARERRDRVYSLAAKRIGDLKAFAAFAFRTDSTRRASFTSEWFRARNRTAKRRRAAEATPAETPPVPAPASSPTTPNPVPDVESEREAA